MGARARIRNERREEKAVKGLKRGLEATGPTGDGDSRPSFAPHPYLPVRRYTCAPESSPGRKTALDEGRRNSRAGEDGEGGASSARANSTVSQLLRLHGD
jgi:hypothetical protein